MVNGVAQQEGTSEFNSVHLRMERDAADWVMVLGGKENYWQTYIDAMVTARFSQDTPLYVASGLLTGSTDINDNSKTNGDPESTEEMKRLVKDITNNQVCCTVSRCSQQEWAKSDDRDLVIVQY